MPVAKACRKNNKRSSDQKTNCKKATKLKNIHEPVQKNNITKILAIQGIAVFWRFQ